MLAIEICAALGSKCRGRVQLHQSRSTILMPRGLGDSHFQGTGNKRGVEFNWSLAVITRSFINNNGRTLVEAGGPESNLVGS